MFNRLLGGEPTNDPATRLGRIIGNVLGVALYPVLAWVAMQGLF